jgi:hypothetical protein
VRYTTCQFVLYLCGRRHGQCSYVFLCTLSCVCTISCVDFFVNPAGAEGEGEEPCILQEQRLLSDSTADTDSLLSLVSEVRPN